MYQSGKPLPLDLRQVILNNLIGGYGVTEISKHLCVAKSSVVNVRNHHSRYGTVQPRWDSATETDWQCSRSH